MSEIQATWLWRFWSLTRGKEQVIEYPISLFLTQFSPSSCFLILLLSVCFVFFFVKGGGGHSSLLQILFCHFFIVHDHFAHLFLLPKLGSSLLTNIAKWQFGFTASQGKWFDIYILKQNVRHTWQSSRKTVWSTSLSHFIRSENGARSLWQARCFGIHSSLECWTRVSKSVPW